MSDEKDDLKTLREAMESEFGHNDDISQEDWQALEFSEKQRAVFLHVFKHYDFTVVDMLLNNVDKLKTATVTSEQILAAWEQGKREQPHKAKTTNKDKKEDV